MDITKVLLTREELPIVGRASFYVPIHPCLLRPQVRIDRDIAKRTFRETADTWYDELTQRAEQETDPKLQEWYGDVFLKRRPVANLDHGVQELDPVGYVDDVDYLDNGFVWAFCISRNGGGSLIFDGDNLNCRYPAFFTGSRYIRFNECKAREFAIKVDEKNKCGIVNVHSHHNIDSYPGALFLRNWAIAYNNEALKQVYSDCDAAK